MKNARDMTEEELKRAILECLEKQRGRGAATETKARLLALLDEEKMRAR